MAWGPQWLVETASSPHWFEEISSQWLEEPPLAWSLRMERAGRRNRGVRMEHQFLPVLRWACIKGSQTFESLSSRLESTEEEEEASAEASMGRGFSFQRFLRV